MYLHGEMARQRLYEDSRYSILYLLYGFLCVQYGTYSSQHALVMVLGKVQDFAWFEHHSLLVRHGRPLVNS